MCERRRVDVEVRGHVFPPVRGTVRSRPDVIGEVGAASVEKRGERCVGVMEGVIGTTVDPDRQSIEATARRTALKTSLRAKSAALSNATGALAPKLG